jgi:similar to stage IV sporulation protein
LRSWQAFLGGYITVRVTGSNPERLLNLALSRGVALWDVRRTGTDQLHLKARAAHFFLLRHLARQARCRVRITGKRGLPFLLGRLRRRPGFAAGLLFFVLALYLAGSLIWEVRVRFPEPVRYNREETVLAEARALGLRPGAWRAAVDTQHLAHQLARRLPQAAYVGVRLEGVRATIEVVERVLPPSSAEAAHIVAAKAGLVEEVLVVCGEPRVRPGDVVRPGQVLISGIIRTPSGGSVVRAEGRVQARVWYRVRAAVPLVETREVATGRVSVSYRLGLAGREVRLWGPQAPPYPLCRVEKAGTGPVALGNYRLPFSLSRVSYHELRREETYRTAREAEELARSEARRLLAERVPASARVLNVKLEPAQAVGRTVVVQGLAETTEDIGRLYPLAGDSGTPSARSFPAARVPGQQHAVSCPAT